MLANKELTILTKVVNLDNTVILIYLATFYCDNVFIEGVHCKIVVNHSEIIAFSQKVLIYGVSKVIGQGT